jgi:prepilin-type N-terminal cleavage/methylation domain-containing protein
MMRIAMNKTKNVGFTIVELLIVIVVIGILAALVLNTFSSAQQRAEAAKRESDLSVLYKATIVARENTGKTMGQITGSYYSGGKCIAYSSYNPEGVEPRFLPKSDPCWTGYYSALDNLSSAANTNLDGLKAGDARGNPYMFDENEGEGSPPRCTQDTIWYFTGDNDTMSIWKYVPNSQPRCL